MEQFKDFIFKLAETHQNKPLKPAARTLLRERLNHFVSQYETPDHPPYSAMIDRALRELNEEKGSNEKSISQYLQKVYDGLPFAHAVLLKHHLVKLCESGDIIVARGKKYMLAGEKNSPNPSTRLYKKHEKRKCRLDLVMKRDQRCHKRKFFIKRRQNLIENCVCGSLSGFKKDISALQRPPGFVKQIEFENLTHFDSAVERITESERAVRQQKRWRFSETKQLAITFEEQKMYGGKRESGALEIDMLDTVEPLMILDKIEDIKIYSRRRRKISEQKEITVTDEPICRNGLCHVTSNTGFIKSCH